jgi:HIRAN domain
MENWIENAPEPRKLFLAWQAPDRFGDRFRWAVGTVTPHGRDHTFRYLMSGAEFERLNQNRRFEELESLGYRGYPASERVVHDDNILSIFMRRLPPRNRSDFRQYMKQFRLSSNVHLSDFDLLAHTEAKLPSDGFSMVDPLDPEIDSCDLMLEVAGFRYYLDKSRSASLTVGQSIALTSEPNNPHDPNAVQFLADGHRIGYVNRLQASTFLHWLGARKVSGILERLNGREEKPRAFVFVRVRPLQAKAAA